jgi:Na+/pantothenate symporter
MKKIIILPLISIMVLAGCTTSPNVIPDTTAKDQIVPVYSMTPVPSIDSTYQVANYSGLNSKTTSSFSITKKNWYIDYSCKVSDPNAVASMVFSFFLYPVNSDNYIEAITFITSPTSARTYVFNRSGELYFKVAADNCSWVINVFE